MGFELSFWCMKTQKENIGLQSFHYLHQNMFLSMVCMELHMSLALYTGIIHEWVWHSKTCKATAAPFYGHFMIFMCAILLYGQCMRFTINEYLFVFIHSLYGGESWHYRAKNVSNSSTESIRLSFPQKILNTVNTAQNIYSDIGLLTRIL